MEALREGLDEVLFLFFREGCTFMHKKELPEPVGKLYSCSHPGNRFREPRFKDWPNCALSACPIYEKLAPRRGPQMQWEAFLGRFDELPQESKMRAMR